jgi:sigma-B regulation protein RsbU (phosphoserine phosphatase)
MKVRGETTGALSIYSMKGPLEEEGVQIAEELARRLGIAMENVRLYKEAVEREEFQRALTELAGAVSSTLDTEAVLEAICSRALELLAVDGVYIWVLQEEENRFYGASACGFRADEFIGLTLDLSVTERGAGQALESGKAFYRHNVTPEMRPVQLEKLQGRSDLFQPLVSRGAPLGVMMITDIQDPERFDDHTLAVTGLLAGFAATALANAKAYERERRVAETLQRSLLAEIPEVMDHFELAHFYAPARQEAAIGGDFYDYIKVGDGRYGLVIGDVSGKGLEAAVVTAMAKYVLRAYAAEDPEPVSVLAKANNAVAKYTGAELFITLIYGLLNTRTKRFKYASAGHEPVLVYRSRDRKVEVGTAVGMAAGVALGQEYMTSECTLSEGDVLVLYTDGLTDARSPDGEFLGIEGLSSMVSELGELSAGEFLEALMDRVRTYTGGEFRDDVAVLVVRPAPSGKP